MVGNQRQAGRQGHLNHGGFTVSHDSPLRGNGFPQGAGYVGSEVLAAGGVNQRGQGSVAAVGHRNQHGLGIRYRLAVTPLWMAMAAARADMLCLNACGAMTIRGGMG